MIGRRIVRGLLLVSEQANNHGYHNNQYDQQYNQPDIDTDTQRRRTMLANITFALPDNGGCLVDFICFAFGRWNQYLRCTACCGCGILRVAHFLCAESQYFGVVRIEFTEILAVKALVLTAIITGTQFDRRILCQYYVGCAGFHG